MKKSVLFIGAIVFTITTIFAQDIEKKWQFEAITNQNNESLFNINSEADTLSLAAGEFNYTLGAKENLVASGDYILQNNLLVFYYNQPNDTIRRYKITEKTDSTLVFTENEVNYKFKSFIKKEAQSITPASAIYPNEGTSFTSIWKGILGMISLIFIAFLFSSNKKAINWKTVGIGLAFQLLIAIGVLKVNFYSKA